MKDTDLTEWLQTREPLDSISGESHGMKKQEGKLYIHIFTEVKTLQEIGKSILLLLESM